MTDSLQKFAGLMTDIGVDETVRKAREYSLLQELSINPSAEGVDLVRLSRYAFLYEVEALKLWTEYESPTSRTEAESSESKTRLFEKAYFCWKSVAFLDKEMNSSRTSFAAAGLEIYKKEFNSSYANLDLSFHIAACGVLSERVPDARLTLADLSLETEIPAKQNDWAITVSLLTKRALTLLCRKNRGWADVEAAIKSLQGLRELQEQFEKAYLMASENVEDREVAAFTLLAEYNLSQIVTLAGRYVQEGHPSSTFVSQKIDRHFEDASNIFSSLSEPNRLHEASLTWAVCKSLVRNSIWFHGARLGEKARKYIEGLTHKDNFSPVLELWPSQQKALNSNLLDPYRRAVLVEMPTSAGKTLVAKFAIVQAKALFPSGTVAYVVPTRALVNQITFDLRNDFSQTGLNFRVEQTIPVIELDPMEEKLLSDPPDVLVTTHEKLDLLLRREHPATANLPLVVADEVHNINDGSRGAKLELLLGTLRREKNETRFLLLSPFLPNADELLSWLGSGQQLPAIRLNWRPSEQVIGSVGPKRIRGKKYLLFKTLYTEHTKSIQPGETVPIAVGSTVPTKRTFEELTPSAAIASLKRGKVLVVCRGKGTATERALDIAKRLKDRKASDSLTAVCNYLTAEAGRSTPLAECLRKGVAFHHAGLSPETRWLVESLIKSGDVDIICGTTTLAQGVNFPISTVIVETLKKGNSTDLTYEDFWNIAGRAGRAMMNSSGTVAFPDTGASFRNEYQQFLTKKASEIVSQCTELFENIQSLENNLGYKTLIDLESLSPFLQFLSHATRFAHRNNTRVDLEDVLRSSLLYHQAAKTNSTAAKQLLALCKKYTDDVEQNIGTASLSDQVCLSTPSVGLVLGLVKSEQHMHAKEGWSANSLFGSNTELLSSYIKMVSYIPEIQLGSGERQRFDAARIANILSDWVNGKSLQLIADTYFAKNTDKDKRLVDSNTYLFSELVSKASWALASLETISLAGQGEDVWKEVGHIPSLVYYGVKTREQLWLRMVGLPRVFAPTLAITWQTEMDKEPANYEQVRKWINSLDDARWSAAAPKASKLTGAQCKIVWKMLSNII